MTVEFSVAEAIFQSKKQLLEPFSWRDHLAGKLIERRSMECRVLVDGAVPRGVFFRISLRPQNLKAATLQLECDQPARKSHVPLYRFELHPLRAHSNALYGPKEINGLFIDAGVSHEHVFYDSLTNNGGLRVGERACQQARLVDENIEDFSAAYRYVCAKLRITNGGDVPLPEAQGWLL